MKEWEKEEQKHCDDASMPLLADLLQNLTRRLPGDSLQSEQAYREPLREQAFQRAAQVLREKKGESLELTCASSW